MILSYTSYKETLERQNEKDQQIKNLEIRLNEYEEIQREGRIISREMNQQFLDIEQKVNALMGIQKKERKYDREFEVETDPVKKFDKHDLMLQATRERIRKQGELEKTLEEQQNK